VVAYTFGCEAAKTTFITSNIVPQLQKNNAGVWEALESAVGWKAAAQRDFQQLSTLQQNQSEGPLRTFIASLVR
jgi:DNA/RNA endonuclease G (NUC1)